MIIDIWSVQGKGKCEKMWNLRTEVTKFLSNCDLRIMALVQISISINFAIRGKVGCYPSIIDGLESEVKQTLLKLEKYLNHLIEHFGVREKRDLVSNYCRDTVTARNALGKWNVNFSQENCDYDIVSDPKDPLMMGRDCTFTSK